jgi:tetratricopeptide (TPR) repeat protein
MMMPEDVAKQGSAKPKPADEVVRYQSGNETIIQPGKSRDFRILTVLFNFGIGISIGIAITISLIMPAQLRSERDSAAEQVRTVGEELDNKTAAIADLEARVERLMEENGYLDQELSAYRGTDISVEASDNLLLAAAAYILGPADGVILNGDGVETPLIEIIANFMEAVPPEEVTVANPAYKELYDSIVSVKGKELGDYYFATGDELYRGQEYNSAIPYLARAFQYDKTNGDALYYLARSYDWIGETDKAKEAYAQVIELFPDTDKATNSDNRLVEINMTGASG